eukprot:3808685-Rhodomonas_salina.1
MRRHSHVTSLVLAYARRRPHVQLLSHRAVQVCTHHVEVMDLQPIGYGDCDDQPDEPAAGHSCKCPVEVVVLPLGEASKACPALVLVWDA